MCCYSGGPTGARPRSTVVFIVPGTSGQQILLSLGIYFHYYVDDDDDDEFYMLFVTGNGSDLARFKACLAAV